MSDPKTYEVLEEVRRERLRQDKLRAAGKFGWTCADPTQSNARKLAVLAEEFGEVAREVCEEMIARDMLGGAPSVDSPERLRMLIGDRTARLRAELIQVAAVAVAWAESLARGETEGSEAKP